MHEVSQSNNKSGRLFGTCQLPTRKVVVALKRTPLLRVSSTVCPLDIQPLLPGGPPSITPAFLERKVLSRNGARGETSHIFEINFQLNHSLPPPIAGMGHQCRSSDPTSESRTGKISV